MTLQKSITNILQPFEPHALTTIREERNIPEHCIHLIDFLPHSFASSRFTSGSLIASNPFGALAVIVGVRVDSLPVPVGLSSKHSGSDIVSSERRMQKISAMWFPLNTTFVVNANRRKAGTMTVPSSDRGIVKVGTAPEGGMSVSVLQSCGVRVISGGLLLRLILSK